MARCCLHVESVEGLAIGEEYLRGYLEAFGVTTHNITQANLITTAPAPAPGIGSVGSNAAAAASDNGYLVSCDRCYDILDRVTSMNADHRRPGHQGRKLRFQLRAESGPFSMGSRDMMGNQPSNELCVSGFTAGALTEKDLAMLFGQYGRGPVRVLDMRESSAIVEVRSMANGHWSMYCLLLLVALLLVALLIAYC
jgi:hypothetical protein